MGQKIKIANVVNYISNILNYINNIRNDCMEKYFHGIILIFGLICNIILVYTFNAVHKTFISNYTEYCTKCEYIDECQNILIKNVEIKMEYSNKFFMIFSIYHLIMLLLILNSEHFYKFYKNNKEIIINLYVLIYTSSTFINPIGLNFNSFIFKIQSISKKNNMDINVPDKGVFAFYMIGEMYLILMCFILVLANILTICKTIIIYCSTIGVIIKKNILDLYEKYIMNIEIIELPNDPFYEIEKNI